VGERCWCCLWNRTFRVCRRGLARTRALSNTSNAAAWPLRRHTTTSDHLYRQHLNGTALAHVTDHELPPLQLPPILTSCPPKMRLSAGLLCIVTQAWTVNANVEKTIFLGPKPVTLPNVRSRLHDFGLHRLSPADTILPIRVPVQFPTESVPRGLESWYLLRGLEDGRRYEVRICWPATVSSSRLPITCRVHTRLLVLTCPATYRFLARHLFNHPRIRHS
jgi:hypothetical protein